MSKQSTEILYVPQVTVSDETALLQEWKVKPNSWINAGEVVCMLETSKSTIEIEAPISGYLHYKNVVGEHIPIGNELAVISDKKTYQFKGAEGLPSAKDLSEEIEENTRFSKAALELIEQQKISKQHFKHLTLVRVSDVQQFLLQSNNNPELKSISNDIKIQSDHIILIGGGGHAKMCIDLINQLGTYQILGILSTPDEIGQEVLGVKILGDTSMLQDYFNQGVKLAVNAIGAIHDPRIRDEFFQKIKRIGFNIPNLIHPSAVVEPSATLGEGNQIMAQAVVGSAARLGNNCIINTGAVISHDCQLSDNVHITPGGILAGNVIIGKNTIVGMGATVYMQAKVGQNVLICNGANVMTNINDSEVVN